MKEKSAIAYAKIHPAIGIARLGNSETEYFLAPEVPYSIPKPLGAYRDENGFIKRQAVRFRIYGYNESGEVVGEITADIADIKWKVEIANKKAAWYNFDTAMDIPEAVDVPLRNRGFNGEDRKKLRIEPGPRSIAGINQDGVRFDTGTFCGLSVYLGELKTDEAGRLIFLGGRGESGSAFGQKTPGSFDNNDGWFDDVSDGPVMAEVVLCSDNNLKIPVEPAWVVTAPPNFAPDITSLPTMYDVIYEVMVNDGVGWVAQPDEIRFMEHIYPIFSSLSLLQWVNFGYFSHYGFGQPFDFNNKALIEKLADPSSKNQEFRKLIFQYFRDPGAQSSSAVQWPWITGDSWMDPGSAQEALSVTNMQYQYLQQWAEGNFTDDTTRDWKFPTELEQIPLSQQPETLDKAALYFLMGGPFHPGIELSWIMRHYTIYDSAFRIRLANGEPATDFGPVLKPADVIEMNVFGIALPNNSGPLNGQSAGDLTKWLSVPWQLELVACSPGVLPGADPYIPAFWPARVPDNVLTEQSLGIIMDPSQDPTKKQAAFLNRALWTRPLNDMWMKRAAQVVDQFYRLGIIQQVDHVDVPGFPGTMYVETNPIPDPSVKKLVKESDSGTKEDLTKHKKVRKKLRK